jgi:hypothetical protein
MHTNVPTGSATLDIEGLSAIEATMLRLGARWLRIEPSIRGVNPVSLVVPIRPPLWWIMCTPFVMEAQDVVDATRPCAEAVTA